VKVEAFGLIRSEYMTLRGDSRDAVTFPRILGIECVGVVADVARARRSSGARLSPR
jgi:NADPH2:quinone reductase